MALNDFNPRPLREGTTIEAVSAIDMISISIHVPYERGRQSYEELEAILNCISIHVPYERGRRTAPKRCAWGSAISIHVPYERGRRRD